MSSRSARDAATTPRQISRARQAVTLLRGLLRDFDRADRENGWHGSKRYVAWGGAGIVCVAARGHEATKLRHLVEEWGGKVQEVADAKLT